MQWSMKQSVWGQVVRGVVLFSAAALLVGGIAGTIQWPIVGTFFDAFRVGLYGPVVGLVVAFITAPMASCRWATRIAGGTICTAVALPTMLNYAILGRPIAFVGWSLVVLSATLGIVLAPMVANGVELTASWRGGSASDLFTTIISRGAIVGAVLGGITGLVIGLFTFAPTAPFAVVEGGILGTVTCSIVSLLIAAVVLLPKVKVR